MADNTLHLERQANSLILPQMIEDITNDLRLYPAIEVFNPSSEASRLWQVRDNLRRELNQLKKLGY